MSTIISIGTATPEYRHGQQQICDFMSRVYALREVEKRKLRFVYNQSSIESCYSVLPDSSLPASEWQFFPLTENPEPFPSTKKRMKRFRLPSIRAKIY